jgi:folate-dependent phosphoribosylglycinamide formyltransferase PurN
MDLIVLAHWMHLFSKKFPRSVRAPIINLHLAYPGEFPGCDAIKWPGLLEKLGLWSNLGQCGV